MYLQYFFQTVVNQNYESELMPTEYVIRGNSAVLKCNVPSFVADFIVVEAWVTNEGHTYTRGTNEIGKSNVFAIFSHPGRMLIHGATVPVYP